MRRSGNFRNKIVGIISLTSAILILSLTSCNGPETVIQDPTTVCPERVWMPPIAKEWMTRHMQEDENEDPRKLAFSMWLATIILQQRSLDICHGIDPNRPSPYDSPRTDT